MTIEKHFQENIQLSNSVEDDFILGATDRKIDNEVKAKGVFKGDKRQISLTISPELLEKLDKLSKMMGLGRATLINLAILQAIENGFDVSGLKE